MLTFIALAEWAGAAGLAWVWLRRRPAGAPRALGRPALLCLALILAQTALFLAIPALVDWSFEGGNLVEARRATAGAAIWLVQGARAVLLLGAFALWARFAYADAAPGGFSLKAPAGLLAISTLIEIWQGALSEGFGAAGLILVLLFLIPKSWMGRLRGLRRAAAAALAFLALIVAQDFVITSFGPNPGVTVPGIGADQLSLLGGEGAAPLEFYERAAAPFTVCTRIILNVLGPAALLAALRLPLPSRLLPSMSLRGLSLRRRFALTYGLIRVLPQIIAIVVLAAGLYFVLGIRAAGRVRESLASTLERAQLAADAILRDTASESLEGADGAAVALERARRFLGPDSAGAFAALRDIPQATARERATASERAAAGAGVAAGGGSSADSAAAAMGVARISLETAQGLATAGAPAEPLSLIGLEAAESGEWRGLIEAGGTLYLMAQRSARVTTRGGAADTAGAVRVAQVFVAVDSLLASRIARDAGVSFRLEALPRTYIARDAKQLAMSRGEPWTDRVIALDARNPADSAEDEKGFMTRPRYFAKDLLPIGDWTQPIRGRGVVLLRLEASLARVLDTLPGGIIPGLLTVGTPFLLIAAFMLFLAEGLAVRAGRNIATSILGDVKTLSEAARRIGEGDLEHRVPVAGKDELAGLASAFNEMTANLKRHQEELLEKERIEADLAVARDIQRKLLPQAPPSVPGLDVAGVSIPSREVGGDLFCFLAQDGGRLGIALGDVSGKSVPAALLMANVLASLKAHAQHGVPAHTSLERINSLLCEDILFGKFVTLFFGVIDPRAGEIRYACAGHNPPLVMAADGSVRWLREAWVPLGIMPDASYEESAATLAPGDVLVIYSDGVTEAETLRAAAANEGVEEEADDDDDDDEMFGEERLATAVAALRARCAADIVGGIVDAMRAFARGAPQSDDVTIVAVKMGDESAATPTIVTPGAPESNDRDDPRGSA